MRGFTWTAGSGFQKIALSDSMTVYRMVGEFLGGGEVAHCTSDDARFLMLVVGLPRHAR